MDFTDILDAQRALQSFQDELAQSEGAVASNLMRYYKAPGRRLAAPDRERRRIHGLK